MASIVGRVGTYRQPKGGFLPSSILTTHTLDPTFTPFTGEDWSGNLPGTLVGHLVEYLTRILHGTSLTEAFYIGIKGYHEFLECHDDPAVFHKWFPVGTPMYEPVDVVSDYVRDAEQRLAKGTNCLTLNDEDWGAIIRDVANIEKYEVVFRGGWFTKPIEILEPNLVVQANIRRMLALTQAFTDTYGPVTWDGIGFRGGFTPVVESGIGGYLTADTLWDTRVLGGEPKREHTLLLLVYLIMGLHSDFASAYRQIRYVGIYNPRLGLTYRYPWLELPIELIVEIEQAVIGYQSSLTTTEWFQEVHNGWTSLPQQLIQRLLKLVTVVGDEIVEGGGCYRWSTGKDWALVVQGRDERCQIRILKSIIWEREYPILSLEYWQKNGDNWESNKNQEQIVLWKQEDRMAFYHFFENHLDLMDGIDFESRFNWLKG